MKFTLAWLKDHLDTTASLDDISKTLTAIGLEVESISNPAEALKPFIVAEILHAEKHPQADKLRVCKVNNGTEELQIVCGAPNARTGIKVALASIGVVVPANGMIIKKSAIRGVESNGMLCSATELTLGGDSEGIIELPSSAVVGGSIVDALGLNDPIIEIAITPNRGDCLGVRGIARDLAAAGIGTLKPLNMVSVNGTSDSTVKVELKIPKCPLFIGCTIKGVKNGASPKWMQQRLKAIGLRPISTLVDITNYINMEYGRPLHVYDAKKLSGNIHVRSAKDGETLSALNDKQYTLSEGMTVIADDSGAIGLGGIVGGTTTGCELDTTDVFLEAALFDPLNIAETGRKLQVNTDARYRFERSVDPEFVITGAELAVAMIQKLCGGESSNLVIAGSVPDTKRTIHFNPAKIATLGGLIADNDKAKNILLTLGFTLTHHEDHWDVTPPSWRSDVHGEADIVEEILRIHSYDTVPSLPLPKPEGISKSVISAFQKRVGIARRLLVARGMVECCTYSFLPHAQAELFGGGSEALQLKNPISEELSDMRPSLLPNLIAGANRNAARGYHNLALCEVGVQFENITPDGQKTVASGIRTGSNAEKNIYKSERRVDVFDAKEDVFAILAALGLNPSKLQINTPAPGYYHPGRSGSIVLGKTVIAHFGELHPSTLQAMDVKFPVVGFEVIISNLPAAKVKASKAKPALVVSDFQSVERDFAFTLNDSVTASELIKAIESADKVLITDVSVFDVYQGKGVEDGKKSIAVSVRLQAMDRTLSEKELEDVSGKIITSAAKIGAILRT